MPSIQACCGLTWSVVCSAIKSVCLQLAAEFVIQTVSRLELSRDCYEEVLPTVEAADLALVPVG